MAVKTQPLFLSFDDLTPRGQQKVRDVVDLVNQRGYKETRIELVASKLGVSRSQAWKYLDLAWNCSLITKVKMGRGCSWQKRVVDPVFIDKNKED